MSLTGANADRRLLLPAGSEGLLASNLAQALARRAKVFAPYDGLPPCPVDSSGLESLADRLWAARKRGLVVCGANDLAAQAAVNCANELLGAYGTTLDIRRPSFQRLGSDEALAGLFAELRDGTVGVLIVHGCNPAAELPAPGTSWEEVLAKVGFLVSTSTHLDETSRLAAAVCPDHHFLESWSDAEPAAGVASVTQPVLRPLGDTRSAIESFAAWSGKPVPMRELVREVWRERLHPRAAPAAGQSAAGTAREENGLRAARGGAFEEFWTSTVHEGWTALEAPAAEGVRFNGGALRSLNPAEPAGPGLSLLLYPKIGVREGRHAQNPWLQELPDPVTKVVWDNYASFSPSAARGLGLSQGDVVRLSAAGASIELPAFIQPGQEDGAVCVALGYGREGTERFFDLGPDWIQGKRTVPQGGRVGVNAALFLSFVGGRLAYSAGPVSVEKTGRVRALACTQEYHSLRVPERLAETPGEERDIVRETTLADYARSPSAGHAPQHPATSLWPASLAPGSRRWAMTVDLSLCTGCSACVLACQAENNVAVVGKDEVARRRDMHWMRIDRYYSDSEEGVETLHQPMFCQQCGNAPCETVCPVIATAGSEDGLNQQVYNRCVGTRYCANNCPYKVRRFNWFEYR
ncbi:MAG: 4Fe-4S dicluster domain-containing protein, partial [Elusimicrobiota bacterium]